MKKDQQQTKRRLYKVFVSYYEGGFWYPLYTVINSRRVRKILLNTKIYMDNIRGPIRTLVKFPGRHEYVHAVLFPNGEVFDAINKMRPNRLDYKGIERRIGIAKKSRSDKIPIHLRNLIDTHRRAMTKVGRTISKHYHPQPPDNRFERISGILASQVDLDD